MVHAKTATIDGQWSTIGTANIDRLSLLGNYEINMEVFNPDVARQMEEIFAIDSSNTVELTLPEWRRRHYMVKFSETVLTPFRPALTSGVSSRRTGSAHQRRRDRRRHLARDHVGQRDPFEDGPLRGAQRDPHLLQRGGRPGVRRCSGRLPRTLASSPSSARITSAMLISAAGRASRWPPSGPRWLRSSPPRRSSPRMLSRYLLGMFWAAASWSTVRGASAAASSDIARSA